MGKGRAHNAMVVGKEKTWDYSVYANCDNQSTLFDYVVHLSNSIRIDSLLCPNMYVI